MDLCDTVHIYYEPLGITATAKCIATVWDVLEERYTQTTFGSPKTNIADTIATQAREVAQTPSRSFMNEAIAHATELITGNLGGYVILHDSNNDGTPDEILIMNTADITTATQVWRWNKNGLGYSGTGYAGPYGTAITADGKIVADFISTGTLNADLIKAGTIEDAGHNSSINMTTGAATLKNLKAKNGFFLVDDTNTTRAYLSYNSVGGTSFNEYAENGTRVATISGANSDGGQLRLYNPSGTQTANIDGSTGNITNNGNITASGNITSSGKISGSTFGSIYIPNGSNTNVIDIFPGTAGGYMYLRNNAGSERGRFFVGSDGDGLLYLFNSTGTGTILCKGQNGNVTCVSVTQTSSRKVKENIKPIEDSEKILELNAVSFDFKAKAQGTDKRGFIAEEVAKVLPNLVTPETEDSPASLDYIGMIPYLQDIIKKQEQRIQALEEKINKIGG